MIPAEIVASQPRVAVGRPAVVARVLEELYQGANPTLRGFTQWDPAKGEMRVSAGGMALVFSLTDAPGGNTTVLLAGHFPARNERRSAAEIAYWRTEMVAMLAEISDDLVDAMASRAAQAPGLD